MNDRRTNLRGFTYLRESSATYAINEEVMKLRLALIFIGMSLALLAETITMSRPQTADVSSITAKIEKMFEEERQRMRIPGAALVIVKDDRVILQKGFGLRDVEAGLPVTDETLFAIGSNTKTFTAMAAVISADEGKLSLDDPPKKYLPYFKLRDSEADAQVTLRDLLSHRAGLQPHGADSAWIGNKHTREEVIRIGMQVKSTAKFRAKMQYNNIMYSAVGEAVAKAQNSTWEEVVASRIFKPLGISAGNFSSHAMQQAKDYSWGYKDQDGKLKRLSALENLDSVAPGGSINLNAKELGQWLRLLLGGGAIDGRRIVSEIGFKQMLQKHSQDDKGGGYGLGLHIGNWSGHAVYWHSGKLDGFHSVLMFVPDKHLGFAAVANVSKSKLMDETIDLMFDNFR
jgi:CubicO group peptidase (beta-lactamase class C family)